MSADLSKNLNLSSLKIEDNLLQSINLLQNHNLSYLNASENELMDLSFYYDHKLFKGIELSNQRSNSCVVTIGKAKASDGPQAESFR